MKSFNHHNLVSDKGKNYNKKQRRRQVYRFSAGLFSVYKVLSDEGARRPRVKVNPLLPRPYAARGCGVASLAEGVAVPLMRCPLLVRAGICNLAMVPVIARLLFTKDAVGY